MARRNSNYRLSVWVGIEEAVRRRMIENDRRLSQYHESQAGELNIKAALERIKADDEARLKTAQEFIEYYRAA